MSEYPVLRTARLRLRPFSLADGPAVQRFAGAREIADTTLNISHPYLDGQAEEWIATHRKQFEDGRGFHLAVVRLDHQDLIGAVGLTLNAANARGELGYWIGVPCWGQGYCTEAARELVRYGFTTLGLQRIHSCHFSRNPASGRVMRKLGMKHEGTLRQHVRKWEGFEDLEVYGMLKGEFREPGS